MPLPHASEVLYSDVLTADQLERIHPGSTHPDIISDSERFPTVADDSFDFVVANHVLEHVSSPIRALEEWHRILRDDGLLLMAIPDKRFTFDHPRERTTLAHLTSDYDSRLPAREMNMCHLVEWAEHVAHLAPGTAEYDRWIAAQVEHGYSVHNHVWVAQDLFDALIWMNRRTRASYRLERWCNSSPLRCEFVFLLRARKSARAGQQPGAGLASARRVAVSQHPLLQLGALAQRTIGRLRRARVDSSTRASPMP